MAFWRSYDNGLSYRMLSKGQDLDERSEARGVCSGPPAASNKRQGRSMSVLERTNVCT